MRYSVFIKNSAVGLTVFQIFRGRLDPGPHWHKVPIAFQKSVSPDPPNLESKKEMCQNFVLTTCTFLYSQNATPLHIQRIKILKILSILWMLYNLVHLPKYCLAIVNYAQISHTFSYNNQQFLSKQINEQLYTLVEFHIHPFRSMNFSMFLCEQISQ